MHSIVALIVVVAVLQAKLAGSGSDRASIAAAVARVHRTVTAVWPEASRTAAAAGNLERESNRQDPHKHHAPLDEQEAAEAVDYCYRVRLPIRASTWTCAVVVVVDIRLLAWAMIKTRLEEQPDCTLRAASTASASSRYRK